MSMNIEKISAENFQQGEELLKSQLNNEYKIVSVSPKRKWLVGPKYCEISYVDLRTGVSSNTKSAPLNTDMYIKNPSPIAQDLSGNSNIVNNEALKDMANEIDSMKEMFEALMKDVGVALEKAEKNSNDALSDVENVLIKNGVSTEIAQSIIKDTVSRLPRRQKTVAKTTILLALKEVLNKVINTSEGYDLQNLKSVMLVGPTGVGKTTTLAKLASILYTHNKEVGLITLDTYRLGAVTQLKEYGNILDFPIEACSDIDELQSSLLKYMDKDCLLIDTTGQNQKKIVVDEELRDMVNLVNPDQLSLVLSATTKTEDLYDCIDKFSTLDVNSIIITKIDETNTLGEVINIAYKYPKLKIAYFTNGQDVPSDIESAKAEKIIKSVINIEE